MYIIKLILQFRSLQNDCGTLDLTVLFRKIIIHAYCSNHGSKVYSGRSKSQYLLFTMFEMFLCRKLSDSIFICIWFFMSKTIEKNIFLEERKLKIRLEPKRSSRLNNAPSLTWVLRIVFGSSRIESLQIFYSSGHRGQS